MTTSSIMNKWKKLALLATVSVTAILIATTSDDRTGYFNPMKIRLLTATSTGRPGNSLQNAGHPGQSFQKAGHFGQSLHDQKKRSRLGCTDISSKRYLEDVVCVIIVHEFCDSVWTSVDY